MEELLEDLSLSRSSSSEDFYGCKLVDGVVPITPPLVPAPSPKSSPPPAPLSSPVSAPSPSPSSSEPSPPDQPQRRTPRNWSPSEILSVVAYFRRFGPRFRKIARLTTRSESAVRGVLARRGFLPPPKKRTAPPVPKPYWTTEEDRALLAAVEATPRNKRGGFRWRAIARSAGLKRNDHALRNRVGRLALEGGGL